MAGNQDQWQQLLLQALASKSGSTDLSSALLDPVLAYATGNYQSAPQMTEDEIYAKHAPELLQVIQNEPKGSIRQVIATQVLNGIPAWTIKDNVRAMLAGPNGSTIQGSATSSELESFVDQLASANQRAMSAMTEQASKQDPFEKQGYPSAKAQYTTEDIVNMAPDVFGKIGQTMEAANPEYMRRLALIDKKFGGEVKASDGGPYSGKGVKKVGGVYDFGQGEGGSPISKEQFRSQVAKQSLPPALRLLPALIKGIGSVAGSFNARTLDPFYMGPKSGYVPGASWVDPFYSETEAQKSKVKRSGKKETKVDQRAMDINKSIAEQTKQLVAMQNGMPGQITAQTQALVDRMGNELNQSGRTPLSDALLKAAIMKRQLKTG